MFKAPNFWWRKNSWQAKALMPLSKIYAYFANKRLVQICNNLLPVPTLCIGNYSLGGTGKTPTARSIYKLAKSKGFKPCIIMRGYKGVNKGTILVDCKKHDPYIAGDEAIVLSYDCEVIVSKKRNKEEILKLINQNNFDFVILDDGFQSRKIYYDYALVLIDQMRNFGNGLVFPSGPMRASINLQRKLADKELLIGGASLKYDKNHCNKAMLEPYIWKGSNVKNKDLYAFCGIGNGDKFKQSLEKLGANIIKFKQFPDHYNYKQRDIDNLISSGLSLVTTAKDYVKLSAFEKDLNIAAVIEVDVKFANYDDANQIINATVEKFLQRN